MSYVERVASRAVPNPEAPPLYPVTDHDLGNGRTVFFDEHNAATGWLSVRTDAAVFNSEDMA